MDWRKRLYASLTKTGVICLRVKDGSNLQGYRPHLGSAICTGNSFAQSDHAFQLANSDPVRVSARASGIILSQNTVFFHQNIGGLGGELKGRRQGG
jgi:hypothetical protein